ncbi:MAG: tetratricopeptide repeat protein [Chloroflexi bacterium]|nr:tetratricopeptide repeat protein [Chloroflexota bacterium]
MTPIPISKTKIIPPRRRPEWLTRKRVLSALFEALEKKLVLVSAPAGYGKTALLIDAVKESELVCCWLSLDELDRDPQRFLTYLLASIVERFPKMGAQTSVVMQNLSSFEEEMERLIVALVNETYETIHEHFVLILDDFHILEGVQPVYDFLNRFVQLVDDNCHIIISSRTLTTLEDLPLMVAREQVGGLSFSDLAFRIEEIQALMLNNDNIQLSDEEAKKLIDETEGWITGLQFSSAGVPGRERRPNPNSGMELSDYLGQQVLDRQKPEMRMLLLRTSLMDEFDASLCEAVLAPFYEEKQDWEAFIQTIVKNNLFTLPVGPEGGSLRYHHLFRDYLRQRMRKEYGDEVKRILERLGKTYESQGEWEKAYAIIRQLGDMDALVKLIDLSSFNNLQNTRRLIERWLRDLPPSIVRTHPSILSVQGTLKLIHGDHRNGVADLESAIKVFRKENNVPQLALALTRHSYGPRYLGDYHAALDDLNEALQLIEDRDALQELYAEALRIKSACLLRLGDNRQALKCLEQVLDILLRLDKQKSIPEVLTDIGLLNHNLGNYSEAEHTFLRVLNIWKQEGNLWAQAGLLNNLGNMYHQFGEYEKAAAAYEDGLLSARRSQHTRMETLISIGIGDLYNDLQDFEIAGQNYDHAERKLEERDEVFLLFSLYIGRANLALSQKDFDAVPTWIQTLEKVTKKSQSHYEKGLLAFLSGKLNLLQNTPEKAVSCLKHAISRFDQSGLPLEAASARVWLASAYVAAQQGSAAVETIKIVGVGKPQHLAISAAGQCRQWLGKLQKDGEAGRIVRALLSQAEKRTARLPHVRREIRRHARVVEVPAAYIHIKGFGNSSVVINNKELSISDFQTQSVRDLFFFFLLQTRPLTKEQIMEQFWQNMEDPAKLRLRFKNDVYRLRRAVGSEVIRYDNLLYSFNRSLNYEYDVEAFESYLARARSAQTDSERMEWYRRAINLVSGPYLNNNYFNWVIAARERLDTHYLSALIALAELHLKQADLNEAQALCQRAIQYQPFYEAAYRLLMQVYHRSASKAGVIQTYEACKTALRKQLSVSPSPETDALYRKLIS